MVATGLGPMVLGLGFQGWLTLVVVLAATILMMLDRVGPDLVMFAALCILVVAGVVSTNEALAGFADPATVTVGVLFVVARAVQDTGALSQVATWIFGRSRDVSIALLRLLVPTAVLSAFLNNTPLVAMFVPVTTGFARRIGVSPSQLLMPLSFAAMLGGTCTLIGTSTNLVVSGLMEQSGLAPLGMFELTWVGVPTALLGIAYLCTIGRRLLVLRRDPFQSAQQDAREYLAEVEVAADSPLAGRTVEAAGLRHLPGLFLAEIRRAAHEVVRPVAPEDVLRPGDHLVFTGDAVMIKDLTSFPGLIPTGETPDPGQELYEVVLSHQSSLVDLNVRDAAFRRRFDAAILAVHRAGERIEGRIGDIVLRAGDTLMLSASPGFRRAWRGTEDFYLVSEVPSDGQPAYQKAPLALAALALMVLLPTATSISMTVSAMGALVFLFASRCITPRSARNAVDGSVLLLIASAFGVSAALEESGVAQAIADVLIGATAPFGPLVLLGGVYLLTMAFSLFISNAAAAALVFPIALTAAHTASLDARPFAVAVAMAASAAFSTPVGYQTNLLVYGPGGYRYMDFVRVGAPLNLVCFAVAMVVVPWIWPFA